jgi:hypothetical protein
MVSILESGLIVAMKVKHDSSMDTSGACDRAQFCALSRSCAIEESGALSMGENAVGRLWRKSRAGFGPK